MSLGAVWGNYERPDHPGLWMAADSRISDRSDKPLIDEGMKLFQVPITCWRPDRDGELSQLLKSRSVGMVAVGGSLVFQHVYATMVAMLGSLVGSAGAGPSNADVAEFAAQLTTIYVRSLGVARPREADLVNLAVGGVSGTGEIEAFELRSRNAEDGRREFVATPLDLSPEKVHFMGNHVEQAQKACREIELKDEPGASRNRAALKVIQAFIDDSGKPSIGGEVQVGLTIGPSFRRMFSVRPSRLGEPKAKMALNAIDLRAVAQVGQYQVMPIGMVVP